jgi:hypothetical protein
MYFNLRSTDYSCIDMSAALWEGFWFSTDVVLDSFTVIYHSKYYEIIVLICIHAS